MSAGPSDISVILSQAGRIEKINQGTLVQPEVAKQILTEQEARARMQRGREVTEPHKAHEITISEQARNKGRMRREKNAPGGQGEGEPDAESAGEEAAPDKKHIIDVVV
jgi:hypothetical protein